MMGALKCNFWIFFDYPRNKEVCVVNKKIKEKGRVISELIVIYTNCYELEI